MGALGKIALLAKFFGPYVVGLDRELDRERERDFLGGIYSLKLLNYN
jgi:hypothetical protein